MPGVSTLDRTLQVIIRRWLCGAACIVATIVATMQADAQIYFQDDFEDAGDSADKWVDLWGTWDIVDGEYQQSDGVPNAMAVVADEYWDDTLSDYTFEVRGKKTGGAEGFLIMFRLRGMMQDRAQALRDHPPVMAAQDPSLEYWWNLGGWGNTRSQVESWGGLGGANSNHTIETDEWYTIQIVNTPTDWTLIINDEEVAKVADSAQDGLGRIGLATWSTQASYDDVLVYGPDGPLAVDPAGKTATTWAKVKQRR